MAVIRPLPLSQKGVVQIHCSHSVRYCDVKLYGHHWRGVYGLNIQIDLGPLIGLVHISRESVNPYQPKLLITFGFTVLVSPPHCHLNVVYKTTTTTQKYKTTKLLKLR